MFPRWTFSLLTLVVSLSSSAQNTAPAAPDIVFKAQTSTVIVDVVVRDKHGNPITGLNKNQFRISDNGTDQNIQFFEAHQQVTTAAPQPLPVLPANTYSNYAPAKENDAVVVLLLDALNTPVKDQLNVRKQMLSFLKGLPTGTRMAIFTLGSELRMLQGFSSDPKILQDALNSKKASARPSPLLAEGNAPKLSDTMKEASDQSPRMEEAILQLKQFEADQDSFQTDQRVVLTLQAFRELAVFLNGIPGRKNVIWLSGSFPLVIHPDLDLKNPIGPTRNYADELNQTTNILASTQVSIYPVDARGILTNPSFSVDQNVAKFAKIPTTLASDNLKFFQKATSENSSMDEIARATGGEAIYNTNGLKEAVQYILREGSTYYTIAYTPSERKYDGQYRKIEVHLDVPNAKLDYRRGYVALDPNAKKNAPALNMRLFQAMMHKGAPEGRELVFKARVLPANPPVDLTKESDRNGENGAKLKGPAVRYQVDWAVDLHPIGLEITADGRHQGMLTVTAIGYDLEGKPLNWQSRNLSLALSPDSYATFMSQGLPFHTELDLPEGEVFLRLGVLDQSGSKVGTTEIPLRVSRASK